MVGLGKKCLPKPPPYTYFSKIALTDTANSAINKQGLSISTDYII